jgi:hypothetical protein
MEDTERCNATKEEYVATDLQVVHGRFDARHARHGDSNSSVYGCEPDRSRGCEVTG